MSELRVATGTPVVIDSSVAFKWFDASESGAAEALELLVEHQRDEIALVAPALLPLEVTNALACRGATPALLERVIRALADADLLLAPLDEWLLVGAAQAAASDGLTLYDALFIALAERLDAGLVTADRRQAKTSRCAVRLIG